MDLTFPRTANFTGAFLNAMLTLGTGFMARDVSPSVAIDGDTACMIQHYMALLSYRSYRALVLLKMMSH